MLVGLLHDFECALQLVILVVQDEAHLLGSFSQGLVLTLQEDQILLGQRQVKFGGSRATCQIYLLLLLTDNGLIRQASCARVLMQIRLLSNGRSAFYVTFRLLLGDSLLTLDLWFSCLGLGLEVQIIVSVKLLVQLNSCRFELVLEHLSLGLQILNLLTQLDDVLLKVNLAIGEELSTNLLHLLRIRLLLDQIQGLLELI